jgi:hypothetical protein
LKGALAALVLTLCATPALAAKGDKADRAAKRAAAGAVAGVVTKVEDGRITLRTRGKQAGEAVITTDASTKFHGVASAADIKPGMRVTATAKGGTATSVKAGEAGARKNKPRDGGKGLKKKTNQ